MRTILARSLISFSNEDLWGTLTGDFKLKFDDGEIETNAIKTLYSAYAWRAFHLNYPNTPMLIKHHVQHTLGGKKLGSKTHLNLIGDVMWSTHNAYVGVTVNNEDGVILRDTLSRLIYEVTNVMFNDLSYRAEKHVVSLDIVDFIEIMEQPKLIKVNATLTPDQESIDRAYGVISEILTSNTIIPHNTVVKAVQCGIVDRNQILQCLGPRGYLTDIDSNRFNVPIMRGYVAGIQSFHDSLIESRSSAKSLYFSKSPLEDAEYFSRKLQLLCQIVTTLHQGDCGSTNYLTWHVKGPVREDGELIYKGDLPYLNGKYYMDPKTNTLKTIHQNDTYLNGQTIQLRSVVAGCCHPDPHGVCATCFGELAYSIPANTNIGHMCSTSLTEKSSQSVLSVKHSDTNALIDAIALLEEDRKYLGVSPDQTSYLLVKPSQDTIIKLIVAQNEVLGLTDINIVEDIEDLIITRVSGINVVGILPIVNGIENPNTTIPIVVNIGKRLASFTYPMLKYIKQIGYEITEKGNVVIDMNEWDYDQPFLTLPLKQISMGDHSDEIAKMIESRVDDIDIRSQDSSPAATLTDLFELVNSKLNVNLAVLEIVIYAAMVTNASEGNYDLPKPWTTKGLGISGSTIAGRSLSASMAYQDHRNTIVNPFSFFNEHRMSHPMDAFLMPQQAVLDMKKTV